MSKIIIFLCLFTPIIVAVLADEGRYVVKRETVYDGDTKKYKFEIVIPDENARNSTSKTRRTQQRCIILLSAISMTKLAVEYGPTVYAYIHDHGPSAYAYLHHSILDMYHNYFGHGGKIEGHAAIETGGKVEGTQSTGTGESKGCDPQCRSCKRNALDNGGNCDPNCIPCPPPADPCNDPANRDKPECKTEKSEDKRKI